MTLSEKILKKLKDLAKEEGEIALPQEDLDEEIADLENDLKQPSLITMMCHAYSLAYLATNYARMGTSAAMNGDLSSWDNINKAIAYQYLGFQIRVSRYDHPEYDDGFALTDNIYDLASIACYSTVYHLDEMRDGCINILLRTLRTPEIFMELPGMASSEEFWQVRIYTPFVLRLYQKIKPIELPEQLVARDLGCYSLVLDHWNEPEAVAEGLKAMCDYHIQNIETGNRRRLAEFDHPPFNLLPNEIHAVYEIRKQLGLTTPDIDHPLLSVPTGKLYPNKVEVKDDLLSRVKQAAIKFFGKGTVT